MPSPTQSRQSPASPASPAHSTSARQRGRLLEAAAAQFAQLGFAGASLREIAAATGLSHAMIRHLVGSKEALWDAAADYLFARMRAALSQALTDVDPTDPVQRAEAQVRASVRTAAQVPSLAGFVMQAGLAGGERYDQLVARYLRPFYEFTLAPFRQLAAEGRVVDVPLHFIFLVATNAAVNPFAQAANSRALAGIDLTDPAVADAYADALVTILKAGLLRGGIGP